MKTVSPKCLKEDHQLGHTARGYILPCCWADRPDLFESDMKHLVQEKFKLDTVKSVEDITQSTEWLNFYADLSKGVGCSICYIYCGGNNVKEMT
tara:strand:+ start:20015 stop:20296 length:282 start_codon:yes stop_codon:yes gene_type:complete